MILITILFLKLKGMIKVGFSGFDFLMIFDTMCEPRFARRGIYPLFSLMRKHFYLVRLWWNLHLEWRLTRIRSVKALTEDDNRKEKSPLQWGFIFLWALLFLFWENVWKEILVNENDKPTNHYSISYLSPSTSPAPRRRITDESGFSLSYFWMSVSVFASPFPFMTVSSNPFFAFHFWLLITVINRSIVIHSTSSCLSREK